MTRITKIFIAAVVILGFIIYIYIDYFKSIRSDIASYRSVVLQGEIESSQDDNIDTANQEEANKLI